MVCRVELMRGWLGGSYQGALIKRSTPIQELKNDRRGVRVQGLGYALILGGPLKNRLGLGFTV